MNMNVTRTGMIHHLKWSLTILKGLKKAEATHGVRCISLLVMGIVLFTPPSFSMCRHGTVTSLKWSVLTMHASVTEKNWQPTVQATKEKGD